MKFLKLFVPLFIISSCTKKFNSTLPYARNVNNFDIKTEHVEHFEESWTYILTQRNHLSISLTNNCFQLNSSKFAMSNLKFNGDSLKFDMKLKKTNKVFQTLYIHSEKTVQINFEKLTLKYY